MLKKAMGLLLCGFVLTACADGSSGSSGATVDRNVTIINNSGATITQFYGSNAGTTDWQEDILGSDVLVSGNRLNVDFNDGSGYCTFDFKAVFADGSSTVQNGIDVCTTTDVTFN